MKCPACKSTSLVMTERQGIEIDYCPDCRGVWLDRGELDKIIERSTSTPAAPQVRPDDRQYQERGYYQNRDDNSKHGHYKKKKRGFFSEIFDFD